MPHEKMIVFDVDGTLIDSTQEFTKALVEFSNGRGLPCDGDKMRVGYTNPKVNDLGWGVALDQQPKLLKEMNDFYNYEVITNHRFMPTLFPDVPEVLEELAGQYDLGIVTARDRKSLQLVLAHYKIDHFFIGYRSLCCANERNYPIKPEPDSFHCLLNETKHDILNTVMIGDTTADIEMANKAGTKSIAALWGYHSKEKLQPANPTLMAEKFSELPKKIIEVFSP